MNEDEQPKTEKPFSGFDEPKQNWSKLPHQLINALPCFKTKAELCVVLYILRHTWGYHDTEKKITMDEFEHGRKRANGTRIDDGVGMLRQAITDGLQAAEKDGFINIEVDESDKGRIKKIYSLVIQDGENHPPEGRKSPPRGQKITPRTEKETEERNISKKKESAPATQRRARHPLFDAITSVIFKISLEDKQAVQAIGGRVGKLVSFLNGRDKATPDGIAVFVKWYEKKYPGMSIPLDAGKFAPHWTAFETNGSNGSHAPASDEPVHITHTEDELNKLRPSWKAN